MGYKRTFDAEDMQELNVNHARQIGYYNKLAKLDEGVPYHVSLEKPGVVIGDDLSDLYGFKSEDNLEKGFESDAPFSWMTSFEEDSQSGGTTTQSTLSDESPESDFLWRPVCLEEDVEWCQSSPDKQVPIGSDHQADIPECVKDKVRDAVDDNEEQVMMMGKCVIPMPDSETDEIGKGRKECVCMDKGSIRCVQQHITENREALFETIGYERCLELGLGEMGEEVAGKLTEDEEDLFHEVVYSNPVSLDRDFWKELKSAFPSRTMKEIVSYYFNVFILRRRAVQNRSRSLDIDSDDDEWQVEYDNTFQRPETPGKSLSRVEEEEEEEVNTEEDSCMSYDFKSNTFSTRCPVRKREESNVGNYWRHCNDFVEDHHPYSFDPCDSILADQFWSKNIDLLPTSNIIDEIFGQDPWDDDFFRGK
ncbi:uncharacterized protein LOC108831504 isoform X2 [Raphanus sativus]|uniref:Uncharacterized protein LOC108831504 isoform X2 n=1 Tax=Raphanus sativus TaxID=3726 RepID=A0A6J0LLD3_RAPSA|nr:uncharacterized protein LOC108831504 isoform X2 [Raphanus sativus]